MPVEGTEVKVSMTMKNVGGLASIVVFGETPRSEGQGRCVSEMKIDYSGEMRFTIEIFRRGEPTAVREIILT